MFSTKIKRKFCLNNSFIVYLQLNLYSSHTENVAKYIWDCPNRFYVYHSNSKYFNENE